MDRIDALRAFVFAVDQRSLSAAGRALRRSPASMTRAIDLLEQRVGTALLQRTTRSIRLTEAGEKYVLVARRVLADLDEAEQVTSAVTSDPQGSLTVTAPIAFGSIHVRPIVDDLLVKHPHLRVRLLLLDRVVNLVEEGVDVAVRIGHLADSALLASAVGSVRRVVVASPKYLREYGRPKTPKELTKHRCIASTALTPHESWPFAGRSGSRAVRVKVDPILSHNVAEAAVQSAVNGLGVTCALSYQVAEHLAKGTLVRILESFELPLVPVHVIRPVSGARTAKVRAFVELATPRLRRVLSADAGTAGGVPKVRAR